MAKLNRGAFNLRIHLAATLIPCFLVAASLGASEHETTPAGIVGQQQATNARDMLSLAHFYYNSNDTSDAAAKQYKLVIAKYPNSPEAEAAQYYLGSYYHRKYYIRREKWQSEYRESLVKAEWEYKRYISKYSKTRTPQWLADASFNLALDFMEQGNFSSAIDQLQRIALFYAQKDSSIYVYQVVWSEDPKDVIDHSFDARELAAYTRSVAGIQQSGGGEEAVFRYVKEWCRARK